MNKHFDDSRYYLARALEHAKLGLAETLEPHATRVRRLSGREPEPEPELTRLEAVRESVGGRARETLGDARQRLGVARADGAADR